ncbi:PVC-type heme-binding CxxCH protein [Chitinophaga defluvii]|uniref:PVC-type heme-binding CxxCH protein n=1 Tax=Chitinophaga defluvii TaxID=3163343 RepID=A0ABV2TBB1_9BACT
MDKLKSGTLLLIFSAGLLFAGCKQNRYDEGKSVENEMQHFVLQDGFDIENVAAEPQVVMPVSMAIDEDGNTYVVEMGDYPFVADAAAGKGNIKMLLDVNGDGNFDSTFVFAQGIPDATSVLPYKRGLLVTAAPNILFMKDTDGDHTADIIDTLFTGFFTGNSEAQITNLTYGVDNWIYANNHGQAGQVKFLKRPDLAVLPMGGHDFRFRLDTEQFEAESGTGQYGLAINDWNHRFYTQNTLHIQTNPIAWRYLHRHDHMPSYNGDYNPSDHELEMFQLTPPPYWRKERSERRQHQYDSLKLNQVEWISGHFTGASGATFYGGENFPKEYYGSIFTGEVAGNLVHRDVVSRTADKSLYTASRGALEKSREFLASKDSWFRPTSFYSGPDGNLYVVDMYRQHIETPVSIPDDLKADMDFHAGNDKGRIYLIFPKGKKKVVKPKMNAMSSAELVQLLVHPGAWWRTNAQRLLIDRKDLSVIPAVREILVSNTDPRFRLRALYTLEGLQALTMADVKLAMNDVDPGVREHGAILSERFPALLPDLLKLTEDSVAYVVFQAALSVGNAPADKAIQALSLVLTKHTTDSILHIAVLTAKPCTSLKFLQALKNSGSYFETTGKCKLEFVRSFGYVNGARNEGGEIAALIGFLQDPVIAKDVKWAGAITAGLLDGLTSEGKTLSAEALSALRKYEGSIADATIKSTVSNLLQLANPTN